MSTEYTWFIEPKDAHTNRVLSENLNAEDFSDGINTAEGKKQLWKCNSAFITYLNKSKISLNVNFRIFNQQGKGQIRPFKIPWKKIIKKLPDTKKTS
ncbi:MAG: hypothetical protein Q8Q23_03515 [bacterium]|nr:hypothetical protein [bacterium]